MADDHEFGPAMAGLTEKQRGFVLAMLDHPGCSFAQAARLAGYSDSSEGAKVSGHYCAHNPAVQAAMREEAGKRLNASSLMAANTLIAILTDTEVEAKDKIKAAGMLLDRSGFGAAQTINVNKTVTDTSGKALMERIEKAAAALGVEPAQLLGVQPMKVIEHEPAEKP